MRRLGWLLWVLFFLASGAHGTSFDCKKAKTDVEKTICGDPELSKLDEQLARLYKQGIERAEGVSHRETLRSWQNAWLKYRDTRCGAQVECLRGYYKYRISIFDRLVQEAKQPPKRNRTAVFTFEFGQSVPVCEEYKRYLDNAAASAPRGNLSAKLMCKRSIPPKFTAFSQPEWKEIYPRDHMDLAIAVTYRMAIPWDGNAPPKGYVTAKQIAGTRESIVGRFKNNHDRWYLGRADVDNDRHVEDLVKYRRGRCNDEWPDVQKYQIPIMVVDEDGKSVDGQKTRQILGVTRGRSFSVGAVSLDVFAYQGRVYVDRWDDSGESNGMPTEDKTLSVYLNERDKNELVCKYWFPVVIGVR